MYLHSPIKCEALPPYFRRSREKRFHLSELLPTAIGSNIRTVMVVSQNGEPVCA
jgi:hypothetical protein